MTAHTLGQFMGAGSRAAEGRVWTVSNSNFVNRYPQIASVAFGASMALALTQVKISLGRDSRLR